MNRDAVDAVFSVVEKTSIHHALLNFIYSNLAAEVETEEIREIFKEMDENFDGSLSRREL